MTYRLWPKWKLVVALGAMALWWGQGASTGTADETAGPVPSSNPLSGDPESIEVGRELYFTWCVQCHGPEADGVAPRWGKYAGDLRKFWRGYTEFATIVVAGRPKKKMHLLPRSGLGAWRARRRGHRSVVAAAMSVGSMRPRQLVWLLLLVLVGAIVAVERTDFLGSQSDGDGHDEREVRMLLPVPVDDLGAVEITLAGTVYRFERDETGAWYHHAHGDAGAKAQHVHQTDSATAERIEAALAAFGRTRIERQLEPSGHTGDYGVTEPDMVIAIYRQSEARPLAGYAVGHVAPDTVSRYVMTVDSSAVVTIPNYQIENLLALIEAAGAHEWATPTSR